MTYKGNALVVGAPGVVATGYVRGLRAAGYEVWAPLAPAVDPTMVTSLGARPVAVDLLDAESVVRAAADTLALVIALGGGSGDVQVDAFVTRRYLDAAQRTGVRHVVYSSTLHADHASSVAMFREQAWLEDMVRDSGLPYTVLRPATLAESLTGERFRTTIERKGVLESLVAIDAPISYLAAADLGAFGAAALEEHALNCATIDIGGPEPVTFAALLPGLAALAGRPLAYRELSIRKARRRMGERLVEVVCHINRRGYVVDMEPVLRDVPLRLTTVAEHLARAWPRPEAAAQAIELAA
jgi:uncharacterized protein YbjT (DUF2867 family)